MDDGTGKGYQLCVTACYDECMYLFSMSEPWNTSLHLSSEQDIASLSINCPRSWSCCWFFWATTLITITWEYHECVMEYDVHIATWVILVVYIILWDIDFAPHRNTLQLIMSVLFASHTLSSFSIKAHMQLLILCVISKRASFWVLWMEYQNTRFKPLQSLETLKTFLESDSYRNRVSESLHHLTLQANPQLGWPR